MTPQPGSVPDPSHSATAAAVAPTAARQFTEPLREASGFALLAGNGLFLLLGFSRLFFVVHRWGVDFGQRCEAAFPTFVGPLSLGLPVLALLLATHARPMVRRTRAVLIAVLVELGVSVLLGAITFMGAFAHDLSSVRSTIEGTLTRVIWLAFLALACTVAARVWLGLNPAPKARPAGYEAYGQPTYGRPYPGQPLYPHGAYPASGADTGGSGEVTAEGGWPVVPPPPRPGPLVVQSPGDQTMWIAPLMAGELTQKIPAVAGELTQKVPAPTAAGELTQKVPAPAAAELTQRMPAAPAGPHAPPDPVAGQPEPASDANPVRSTLELPRQQAETFGNRPAR